VEGTGTVQKFANGLAVFTLTAGFKNSEKSTVIISYSVPKNGRTTLAIYSLQGTLVRTIISGMQPAGFHTIAWNSRDEKGSIAARGMYIVSLKQDKNFIWQRIIKTE
jgi:flagellar hook assembly protein FlgD